MNDRESLLRKIRSIEFCKWELKIYLDTHPHDCDIQKKLEKYTEDCKKIKDDYIEKYGPLNESERETERWSWIRDPWPWEINTKEDNE